MRDLYVIGLVVVAAIVLGTCLFFFGPTSLKSEVAQALQGNVSTNNSVPVIVLAQGANAVSITTRTNYRIQNVHDLDALWELVYGYNDTPNPPSIDFSKYEVLAVFDGSHTTNGYTISVISITDENASRLVSISHGSSASSCVLKHMQTSPFEIIEVPATSLALTHQDQMSTSTCP